MLFAWTEARVAVRFLHFAPTEARWVRMLGHQRRSTVQGYTLFEFRVFR